MSEERKNVIDEALFNFCLEADKEIIQNSLEENIEDMDAYEKKRKKLVFMLTAGANLNTNNQLVETANKLHNAVVEGIEKPIAMLKEMIQNRPSFALYRNLDQLTPENITEIIKDQNLVDLLEKLEDEENL